MEANPRRSLLRGALATVLACGLMWPATALAANDRTTGSTPQALTESVEKIADALVLLAENSSGTNPLREIDTAPAAAAASAQVAAAGTAADPSGTLITVGAPNAEGWYTAGGFKIKGGTPGDQNSGDWYLAFAQGSSGSRILHVRSSAPLTLTTESATADTVRIEPGTDAWLTLAGVTITPDAAAWTPPINIVTNINGTATGKAATWDEEIVDKTSLHLTLANGTQNTLTANAGKYTPGIRCGWGSILTIDDGLYPVDADKRPVSPKLAKGRLAQDTLLSDGSVAKKGDPAGRLDATDPGKLTITGTWYTPGIGSAVYENSGAMTFNGGTIQTQGVLTEASRGGGIGGGYCGSATKTVFNGGTVRAEGGMCAAAIGAGIGYWYRDAGTGPDLSSTPTDAIPIATSEEDAHGFGWFGTVTAEHYIPPMLTTVGSEAYHTKAGDIAFNGGDVTALGSGHGNAIGRGCPHTWSSNAGHVISVTGGNVRADARPRWENSKAIGAVGGYTVVTGGSLLLSTSGTPSPSFMGLGDTAFNTAGVSSWADVEALGGALPDTDKVFMMEVDLSSEIAKRNGEAGITESNLCEPILDWSLQVGGVPQNFGSPAHFENGKLYLWLPESAKTQEVVVDLTYQDKNGKEQELWPLFKKPDQTGNLLKQYVSFEMEDWAPKYYDGKPLEGVSLPIHTADNKDLTETGNVRYRYQAFSDDRKTPLGSESAEAAQMPADAGTLRVTVTSDQFAAADPTGFGKAYWGHRAQAWSQILPIASKVEITDFIWADDGQASTEGHPADKTLSLTCSIRRAETVDGKPGSEATKDTCAAPAGGYIQLWIDNRKVGAPKKLVFAGDKDGTGAAIPAGDPRINAVKKGDAALFTFTAAPSEADELVPTVTPNQRHTVSAQYLPPATADGVPANYLASAEPTDPEGDAPEEEMVVSPIDPNPTVAPEKDPAFPDPTVTTGPGKPDDPAADPAAPGNKTFAGEIATTWGEPTEDNPHPGRVILIVATPSSGPISVTDADGNIFAADFVRDKDGDPVREGGAYRLVIDPSAVGRGQLVFRQAPNGAYTGSTWRYEVTVRPDAKVPPAPALSKTAENLTHPGGPTQPGDRIRYTVTASNKRAGSAWTQVVIADPLPACLALDEATLRLDNPRDGLGNLKLAKAPAVAAGDVGRFSLSADGELAVPAGTVYGGAAATLTFECTVRGGLDFSDADAIDLANVASAKGKRPNPDDPAGEDVDLDPEPNPKPGEGPTPTTPPATPPGAGQVAPSDPEMELTKAVENATTPGAKVTRIGDTLRYTVTLKNTGAADSCLTGAVISDPLPAGLKPVAKSIKLALPGGREVAVDDAAYDPASRTIAVTAGDVWGGQQAVLTFDATVGEEALGTDVANIAHAHGTVPSTDPDGAPESPEPGKPAPVPGGEPVRTTDPAEPPILVGDDPGAGDVKVAKRAENTTSADGKTRVGDVVRYAIELENDGPATSWMDAVIRDDVPVGLEPVSGTIKMTLPDGVEIAVDDAAYDHEARRLSVAAGHLYGGQAAVLSFDALVTEEAVGADIGNVAVALGMPPSKWDPDGEFPEPGRPFDPPEGWEAFGEGRETVESPAAYPDGTDEKGGVLPADGAVDDGTTIRKLRLAQTGDALIGGFAFGGALALLAALALVISWRHLRRQH